ICAGPRRHFFGIEPEYRPPALRFSADGIGQVTHLLAGEADRPGIGSGTKAIREHRLPAGAEEPVPYPHEPAPAIRVEVTEKGVGQDDVEWDRTLIGENVASRGCDRPALALRVPPAEV